MLVAASQRVIPLQSGTEGATLGRATAALIVRQNPTHKLSGDPQEMYPVFHGKRLFSRQPDVSFMDQGGWLQRVIRALLPEVEASQATQILVNKRKDGFDGFPVSAIPTEQQRVNLVRTGVQCQAFGTLYAVEFYRPSLRRSSTVSHFDRLLRIKSKYELLRIKSKYEIDTVPASRPGTGELCVRTGLDNRRYAHTRYHWENVLCICP